MKICLVSTLKLCSLEFCCREYSLAQQIIHTTNWNLPFLSLNLEFLCTVSGFAPCGGGYQYLPSGSARQTVWKVPVNPVLSRVFLTIGCFSPYGGHLHKFHPVASEYSVLVSRSLIHGEKLALLGTETGSFDAIWKGRVQNFLKLVTGYPGYYFPRFEVLLWVHDPRSEIFDLRFTPDTQGFWVSTVFASVDLLRLVLVAMTSHLKI